VLAFSQGVATLSHAFRDEDFVRREVDRLEVQSGLSEAVINNARRAADLAEEAGSLASYFWRYEPHPTELTTPQTASTSPASIALSKDLKKRGWRFVGPTTVFAFMQAMGLINDHSEGCAIRSEVEADRAAFQRP
jgi:DNA-3-methyladenine glycosylase I